MTNEKLTISVSSAKTFQDCNMQYFIGSVLKIRKPDAPATLIGTKFAELTEALANGEDTSPWLEDENQVTVKMLYNKNKEFLDNLEKEVSKAEFELAFGINLYISYSGWIDAIIETEDKIILRDYKTCGSWQYTLTDKNLGVDEQLNIYGYFIHTYYNPKNKPIWLEHQQFHKGTGMRKEVRVPYNHEEGKVIYDWIVEQAEGIIDVRRLNISKVNKNFDSCGKFGGCPYQPYCKGNTSLEELKEMLNPNVKERTKEELTQMKPEERLAELRKEQEFNKKGKDVVNNLTMKKGENEMGLSIREKLMAVKAKQAEASAFVAVENTITPAPVGTVIDEKRDEVIEKSSPEPLKPNVETKTENPLNTQKRTRRTKAEMEAEKQISKDTTLDALSQGIQIIKGDTKPTIKAMANNVVKNLETTVQALENIMKQKQVLVLVGCSFLEEDKNNPSDFLHEKYIKPVLEQERIPHISCSEFSKANKQVMLFGESILNEIYEKYEHINIDFRRPVDALVYSMILDIDVRKNGNRFRLIRSTF